jgi:hypothetical protein
MLLLDAKRPRLDANNVRPTRKKIVATAVTSALNPVELKSTPTVGTHEIQAVPVIVSSGKISHKPTSSATGARTRKTTAILNHTGNVLGPSSNWDSFRAI